MADPLTSLMLHHHRGLVLSQPSIFGLKNEAVGLQTQSPLQTFVDFIVTNHLGDVASVIALIVTLVGFGFALYGIWKSKTAAERAEEAASSARKEIVQIDTVAAISAAITAMEEVKRLHRVMAWQILPDRYAAVRKALISVRSSNHQFTQESLAAIQDAIQHFTEIENEVEKTITLGRKEPSQAKLNEIVSRQIDKLVVVQESLRNI